MPALVFAKSQTCQAKFSKNYSYSSLLWKRLSSILFFEVKVSLKVLVP